MHISYKVSMIGAFLAVAFVCLALCDSELDECQADLAKLEASFVQLEKAVGGRLTRGGPKRDHQKQRQLLELIADLEDKRDECKRLARSHKGAEVETEPEEEAPATTENFWQEVSDVKESLQSENENVAEAAAEPAPEAEAAQ